MQIGIVDDHPVLRLGLRQALSDQPGVSVRWDVGSATQARRMLQESPVDIVLMDVYLSDMMDGVDATRLMSREHPEVPVIMISAVLDEHVVFAAGKAGAAAYLSKNLEARELVSSIRAAVASRANGNKRARGSFRLVTAHKAAMRPRVEGKLGLLSRREMEVLEMVRNGRTNREIAGRLGISQTTVNKHVHRVLTKLGARNRAHAATLMRDPMETSASV